jgi:hypothetical protein
MNAKIQSIQSFLGRKILQLHQFLTDPKKQRGEESASVAALTGLVLLIILVIMAIFRDALTAAFQRIAALLSF